MKKFAARWHRRTPGKKSTGIYLAVEEVEKTLRAAVGDLMDEEARIHLGDSRYFLPELSEVREIVQATAVDRRKWVEERFDCDDFAWILKSHFVEAAYKDGQRRAAHCVGVVWGLIRGEPHAVNWVLTSDRIFRFIEPQTDEIWQPTEDDREIWMMIS